MDSMDVERLQACRPIPVQEAVLEGGDGRGAGIEEPCGALHNRVEYRLDLSLRAADYVQNAAGCSLILKRFLQLSLAGLLCLEQPRVLDGDHGLVGEGLEQIYLSVGERANLCAPDGNYANCLCRAQQRNAEYGAVTESTSKFAALRIFIHLGLLIGEVDRSPVEDRTPSDSAMHQGHRGSGGIGPMWRDGATRA